MTTTSRAARDGGGTVEWILEVAGLGVRYYSGHVPPPSKLVDGVGDTYVDVPAIVGVGDWSESVNPARAWFEAGAVTIELLSGFLDPSSSQDPGAVFSTVGHRSAEAYAQIVSAITAASATIELDRPWTAPGVNTLVHVGRESIFCQNLGAAGPPYLLNIVNRAVAGSWQQEHLTDEWTGLQPEASDTVISWLGRPAYLYFAVAYDGTSELSEPALWAPCVMTASPSLSETSVTVTVSPITALLDRSPGGALQTPRRVRLLEGVHRFYAGAPNVWSCVQYLPDWALREMPHQAGAAGVITLTAFSYTNTHALTYAAAQAWLAGAPIAHPRWGHLNLRDTTGLYQSGVTGGGPVLTSPGTPALGGGIADSIASAEIAAVDLVAPGAVSADLLWPDGLSAALAARFTGSAVASALGTWCDVVLSTARNELVAKPNFIDPASGQGLRSPCQVLLTSVREAPRGGLGVPQGGLWNGILDVVFSPNRWEVPTFPGEAPSAEEQVLYPLRFNADPVKRQIVRRGRIQAEILVHRLDVARSDATVPVIAALGWRELGEPSVFVDQDPGIPATGASILVEWTEPDGESRETTVVTNGPAVADTVSGVACWRLDLVRAGSPSFGSWPGQSSCTLTPIISWGAVQKVDSATLLLELLESSGSGALGTYDRQPWGAGIPSEFIDEDSFLGIEDPPGFGGWAIDLLPDSELAEVLTGILLATQTHLVIRRRADGTAQIVRLPTGIPIVPAAGESLTDLVIEGGATSDLSDYLVNQYKVTVRAGDDEDTLTYVDQRSVARHGEGQSITLDLRGLDLSPGPEPAVRALEPVIGALAGAYGSERRVWTVTIPTRVALGLWPGADVLVTSDYLYGTASAPGVSSAVARVTSISHDLTGAQATVTLDYYGEKTTAINAAMRVLSIVDTSTVTVDDDYYTAGVDPLRGVDNADVGDFASGDIVWLYVEGDPDGGAALTIATITGPAAGIYTVAFTAAHGLASVPAIIEPATYDSSGPGTRQLAYLADATSTLGAAGDEAMSYT